MSRRSYTVIVLLGLGLVFAPLAQAVFRGDEMEHRDFNIGSRYFINEIQYMQSPWAVEAARQATNRYIGAAGSISGTDLYLQQNLSIQHALSSRFHVTAEYDADRDFDSNYQRFLVGLYYRLSPQWQVGLVGEPVSYKDQADMGGALTYEGDLWWWHGTLLFPSFKFPGKNPDKASMNRRAINAQWEGGYRVGSDMELRAAFDLDFPLQITNPKESFQFDFEKYQAMVGAVWRPQPDSLYFFSLEGEHTRKDRVGLAPEDANAFSISRDYGRMRLEHNRWLQDAFVRLGAQVVLFGEDHRAPFDPVQTLNTDRRDHMIYGGYAWPVRSGLRLHYAAAVNWLELHEQAEDDAWDSGTRSRTLNRLQAKIAVSLEFHGPNYAIEMGPSFNIDETRFGGGFVKLYLDF